MSSDSKSRCEFESDKLVVRLDIIVAADVNAISPIVQGVLEIIREMKCAAGKEYEIEFALREALADAIIHGCQRDPAKKVECCVACDLSRGMLIVAHDPGPGFDPASLPNPVVGQNIFSEHGRGIYLITQFMDEVRFERGGTEIHMRKY